MFPAEPIYREAFARALWVAMTQDRIFGRDKKIPAIKFLRNVAGIGLKEAKDAIEAATLDEFERIVCQRPNQSCANPFSPAFVETRHDI